VPKDKGGAEPEGGGLIGTAKRWTLLGAGIQAVGVGTIVAIIFAAGGKSADIERNKGEIGTLRGEVQTIRESVGKEGSSAVQQVEADIRELRKDFTEIQQDIAHRQASVEDAGRLRGEVERLKERSGRQSTELSSLRSDVSRHLEERGGIDRELKCAAFEAARYSFWQICRLAGGEPDNMTLKCNRASNIVFINPAQVDPTDCPQIFY
jgi:regulator of replication initiation timing